MVITAQLLKDQGSKFPFGVPRLFRKVHTDEISHKLREAVWYGKMAMTDALMNELMDPATRRDRGCGHHTARGNGAGGLSS